MAETTPARLGRTLSKGKTLSCRSDVGGNHNLHLWALEGVGEENIHQYFKLKGTGATHANEGKISQNHGEPEIYMNTIKNKSKQSANTIVTGGGGGGGYEVTRLVEKRLVSIIYFIVDSKTFLLSVRSRDGCTYKYNSG